MFFEINKNLSEQYSGLNPLNILDYPAEDVLNLIINTIEYSQRKAEKQKVASAQQKGNVIYRPARDDWF